MCAQGLPRAAVITRRTTGPDASMTSPIRPAGDVSEAVAAGAQSQCIAHDVSNGLHLDLCQLPAPHSLIGVESVPELVDKRLHGLCRGDIGRTAICFWRKSQ